jgi:hypothetical protein
MHGLLRQVGESQAGCETRDLARQLVHVSLPDAPPAAALFIV